MSQSKQPVGALFLKVINTLALLKTPRSTIKLKATLFVKKSRIAGSTYRSAGHRRIPKGSRQKIDYSEDSSDISVTSSLEKREIALPALSKSRAVQQGSFIDGHGSSSLGNQNPEALGVGLDSKQNLSKIEPDSDQRLASLRKTDGLRSGNSSRTLSLVSTKPSSHTSSRLSSPSHTLQIPIENSRKKNTDTFGTLTGVAHQLSKSSELECENDRLAAFIEEEKNCTKSIIGSYDAYAHSPSKRNTGVRSTVLSPLRDDRISASAGGCVTFLSFQTNSSKRNGIFCVIIILLSIYRRILISIVTY